MNEPVEVYEVTGAGAARDLACKRPPRADSLALSGAMQKSSSFAKRLSKHERATVRLSLLSESLVSASRACSMSSPIRIARRDG